MENEYNLKSIAPGLAKVIKELQLSQVHIAKNLYAQEWSEEESMKRVLTGRLRNKIAGGGKLSEDELFQIQHILLKMAETIQSAVRESFTVKKDLKKEKILALLQHFDEEERKEILKGE
jgi:hypothetical protein